MINPTHEDIGRRVVYHPPTFHWKRAEPSEVGEVIRWNDHFVFVRFGTDGWAKACRREDLEWEYEK